MNTPTTKKTRAKAPAMRATVPQTKEDATRQIYELGIVLRAHQRMTADLNDKIAALTKDAQPGLDRLKAQAESLQAGLQTFCEANRDSLLKGGGKTAKFITGDAGWRIRPPSVTVRGVDDVLQQLRDQQLYRFIREKFEVNKEAVLNDPEAVANVKGLTVVTDVEDFFVVPFEATT